MTSLESRHNRTPTDAGGPSWLVSTSAQTTADTGGRRRMCHRCAMTEREHWAPRHGLVGGELGDDDPIPVRVEQMRQPNHDNVVVVDQRHPHRRRLGLHAAGPQSPLGVYTTARAGSYVRDVAGLGDR